MYNIAHIVQIEQTTSNTNATMESRRFENSIYVNIRKC